jgi:hypothetical protein
MQPPLDNWLNELLKNDLIETFDTTVGSYYRIKSASIRITTEVIQLLKSEYRPGVEKGGYLLISPIKDSNRSYWTVSEVRFIKNIHSDPANYYKMDPKESDDVKGYSLDSRMLPLPFHSHPTSASNVLLETRNYYCQLNTSDPDKLHCLFNRIPMKGLHLRLPEILVVCNGNINNEIFIGLYGGLVAPIDFTERKEILQTQLNDKILENVENFFDTPGKQLMGIIGLTVFAFLAIKYPKTALLAVGATASILPSIAYSSKEECEFFGVSHGSPLSISISNIPDEIIRRDELHLIELYKKWEQSHNSKAA